MRIFNILTRIDQTRFTKGHWAAGYNSHLLSRMLNTDFIAGQRSLIPWQGLIKTGFTKINWAAGYYSHLRSRMLATDLTFITGRESSISWQGLMKTGFTKGNWAAGYYSHLWSRMLAADLFSAYLEAGWENTEAIRKVETRSSIVWL